MIPRNCLSETLDRLHADGGYLSARRSAYWGMPHVLHVAKDGQISNYVPPARLPHPIHALVGFDGVLLDHDPQPAPPMPLHGIVLGSWLLAIGATAWALSVLWRRALGR